MHVNKNFIRLINLYFSKNLNTFLQPKEKFHCKGVPFLLGTLERFFSTAKQNILTFLYENEHLNMLNLIHQLPLHRHIRKKETIRFITIVEHEYVTSRAHQTSPVIKKDFSIQRNQSFSFNMLINQAFTYIIKG